MSKAKYGSWVELFAAFDSGELDKANVAIVMDNDGGYMRYDGNDLTEDEADKYCENLFHPGGYNDVVDILNAAGYPADWC